MEKTKFKLPAHPNKEAYEKQRLVELIRLGTMKSPEMRFQAIVDRVRAQYNVPYCMISFIDECKLMGQASHGFSFKEMDADQAICAYAMHEEDMFVVEDAATSDLLRDYPFVKGPPFIRFYAGIPIRSRGVPVGTLCLADVVTRTVSTIGRSLLKQFAADAEKAISEPDMIYQDIDFSDPGVRSEYLVYNKFLDESIKFFTTTDSNVVFIRLMPDSSASSPIPDSDLMQLSDNLNKYLHGINYRKGTFGHCNILLVIENSKFNGYGNAYLCGFRDWRI